MYTKLLGVITGISAMLIAVGYGFLALLGAGLSGALHSSTPYSLPDYFGMMILLIIAVGLITCIGAFKQRSRVGFYKLFCFVVGIVVLIVAMFSFRALGTSSAVFLIFVGALYVLLGFLAKRGK